MTLQPGGYFAALSTGNVLDTSSVEVVMEALASRLTLEAVPPALLRAGPGHAKITEQLSRLPIRVATAPRGWGGLVVGFPGASQQFTAASVTTPYLRHILYPMLDLHARINAHYRDRLPCLYLIGVRFPDVFIRKFQLLSQIIPHVIILTPDMLRQPAFEPPVLPMTINEQWVQVWLRRQMMRPEGLHLPLKDDARRLGYLSHEVSTGEGSDRRERLDILGVDMEDGALVAFEIKGPDCGRVDLENLFLQGLDHLQWLEQNKLGLKLMLDRPRGRRINTRKRARLLLGFFGEVVPDLFSELRREAMRRDPYLRIGFVRFALSGDASPALSLVDAADDGARDDR